MNTAISLIITVLFVCSIVLVTGVQSVQSKAKSDSKSLDQLISYHQKGLELMKSVIAEKQNKEIKSLLQELIASQEKELERLNAMRSKVLRNRESKGAKENFEELGEIRKELEEEFRKVQERMDLIIASFTEKMGERRQRNGPLPKVEIQEDEKTYNIKAEVPGMSKENIKVKLQDNELVITGERHEESVREAEGEVSSEFNYGNFSRSIPLEEKVDAASLKTDYQDGILNIRIRKKTVRQL